MTLKSLDPAGRYSSVAIDYVVGQLKYIIVQCAELGPQASMFGEDGDDVTQVHFIAEFARMDLFEGKDPKFVFVSQASLKLQQGALESIGGCKCKY